jgi:hypothetical protein
MSPTKETARRNPRHRTTEIDPTAPAGSKTSLGEESVRDGRPSTGSEVVEAIDEEGPAVPAPNTES